MSRSEKDRDEFTGIETTGHEWDGIKELNNPLPAWWLWVFYVSIAFSVVYWILMPSWPLVSSYTTGLLGASDRANVEESLADLTARRGPAWVRMATTPIDQILTDPELRAFAERAGASAFGDNCAGCHGTGGGGLVGYPNLNDDVWLWGGSLTDIHTSILHGVRNESPDSRKSQMPAFGREGTFDRAQVGQMVEFVLSLSGLEHDAAAAAAAAPLYAEHCAVCHGDTGQGMREVGAPNLTDREWLYGSERQTVFETIWSSRQGVMPGWQGRLDDATINALTVYVHSRGGGEP